MSPACLARYGDRASSSGSREHTASAWEIERDDNAPLWDPNEMHTWKNMKAAGDACKTICSYAGKEPESAKLEILAAMDKGEVDALDELMARMRAVKNWRLWKQTGSHGTRPRYRPNVVITEQERRAYEALMGSDGREPCSESESAIILSALPERFWEAVAELDNRMRMCRNLPATMDTAGEENADNAEPQKAARTCTSSLVRHLLFR